jgi:hypothetical protein
MFGHEMLMSTAGMDFLAPLVTFFKSTAKVFGAVAIVSAVILFAPGELLKPLGLDAVRDQYRGALAVALFLCVAFLIVDIVAAIYAVVKSRMEQSRLKADKEQEEQADTDKKSAAAEARKAKIIEFLSRMTEPERAVCRKFIEKERRTCWLNAESGVVTDLVRRGVLYQANQMVHLDMNMQALGAYFSMNDSSWDYLHEHSDCLSIVK